MPDLSYDDFERQLRSRLEHISDEIEQAKEHGRAAMSDPTDVVGRQLAAQQIKIKHAERSRVAAMLAGVQAQQSELMLSTITEKYVSLMKTSSKIGSNISEKQVEGVVNAYQSRLDGSHAAANLLSDSAEDTLESTMDSSVNFLTQDDGGANPDQTYAALFGMDTVSAPAPAPAPASASASPGGPGGPPGSAVRAVSDAGAIAFPEVPTVPPGSGTGSGSGGHRRTHSFSGNADEDSGIAWMLAAPVEHSTGN